MREEPGRGPGPVAGSPPDLSHHPAVPEGARSPSRPPPRDELSEALRRASEDGLTVKPVGTGHSFT
ncbi:hypothetical protein ACWCXC_34765, partial [Streptomyces sp. NPDC001515]